MMTIYGKSRDLLGRVCHAQLKLCLLVLMLAMADLGHAQNQSEAISLSLKNVPLTTFFKKIEAKTRFTVLYRDAVIANKQRVTVNSNNRPLQEVLQSVLTPLDLQATFKNRTIVITEYEQPQMRQQIAQTAQPHQTVRTVSGQVIDEATGETIIGASVVEKGTNNGAVTDIDGKFSLNVRGNAPLQISYLGYSTVEVAPYGSTPLRVRMAVNNKLLDEVVVVGYGTQRKSLVTSAITTFKPTENTRIVNNPGDLLDGSVAGVTISKTSGNLGSGLSFSVRGAASLNAGNNPLIVVDGIPLINYSADINSMGESMSSLSTINTTDIESIEVLKDAASAAIYGSRATNGVILITTKTGREGKAKLDVNVSMGVSNFANKNGFKMVNSTEYLQAVNEGIDNYNAQNGLKPGDLGYLIHRVNPFGDLPDVDWLGMILRTGYTYNADFALSGGSASTNYFIGGNVLSQDGVIKKNHFTKYGFKTNVKHSFNKWLEVSSNNNVVYNVNNRIPGSGNGSSVIGRSITQRPYDRPYRPNGGYYVGGTNDLIYHNIIQMLNEEENYLNNFRYLGTLTATLHLAKNLSVKNSLSVDVAHTDDNIYYNANHSYGRSVGVITEGSRIFKSYLLETYANYNNSIGKTFNYDLMLGHSFQRTDYKKTTVEGQGYPSPSFDVTGVAAEIVSAGSSITAYAMDSYFGRANLSYLDRYIVNLTLRADGSSKFAKANRYGYFPSVSLGWNASNEKFWKSKGTDLKVRLSYGRTGNQEGIGIYASQPLISGGNNYKMKSGIAISSSGNEDLQWEKADQYNVGFDLAFLHGKINMVFDAYLKNTLNLLYNKPVPTTSGFTSIISNIGSMQNKGIEFTLNGHFNFGDLRWTSSLNIAHNKNKLTKLLGDQDIITYGSLRAYQVGREVGAWYLYKAIGIYQTDEEVPEGLYKQGVRAGDVKYEGYEDGKIDANDLRFVGSSNPKIFGGWNNTFTYKNFELNLMLAYKFGQKVYSVALQQSERIGGEYGLTEEAFQNRWTGPGTSNTQPRAYNAFTNNYKYSTRHLQDGSFIRMRSATFSYKFSKVTIAKLGLKALRLYVQGDNLFLITTNGYRGYDPEIMNNTEPAYQGYDNYIVPQPRIVTFGLNATF